MKKAREAARASDPRHPARTMYSRQNKIVYFTLEGMQSFATVIYFYYFYFYMHEVYGFGNKANLLLAALNGLVCAVFAWLGGKFAHRYGYFTALKLGFGTMLVALATGATLDSMTGQVLVMVAATIGMCFTWATLEALVSGEETRAGLQHMVGIYNVVWAATGALAYFMGGAILDRFGLRSLFYLPVTIHLAQLIITFRVARIARPPVPPANQGAEAASGGETTEECPPGRAPSFLRMAWIANPFAYIAINTLVAVMPDVAGKMGMTATLAGFCCSIWCFARLGAFVFLWRWDAWHYRFRWLLAAFVAMIVAFATILLVPRLPALMLAQVLFGGAIGLIYYSSLFYSMDLSEAKSEHGGIHEAAIGLGNCAGPAVGAAALIFLPQYGASGAVAVSALLLCGLGSIGLIWRSGRRQGPALPAAEIEEK